MIVYVLSKRCDICRIRANPLLAGQKTPGSIPVSAADPKPAS